MVRLSGILFSLNTPGALRDSHISSSSNQFKIIPARNGSPTPVQGLCRAEPAHQGAGRAHDGLHQV